jgi:glucose-6-phosphate 1-dehydrogenase
MSLEPPPPQAIVIFGGSGDLSRRKVLPGLAAPPKEGVPPQFEAVRALACGMVCGQGGRSSQ